MDILLRRKVNLSLIAFNSRRSLQVLPPKRLSLIRDLTIMSKRDAHGHSHGFGGHHHHHHDNVYLTSKNKNDAGVRITRIGLYSNLGMAIAKGIGGYVFNSHAMIADAWHSVTDLASDILTLMTVSWSLKDPTKAFPTGFGKVESLGSLGVSGMLLAGGLLMGWSSIIGVLTQLGVDSSLMESLAHDHGHSHSHSHSHTGAPSIHAIWLAAGTIMIKEWLYHASKCEEISGWNA
jgi:divalent metal cation (Fe/Co/Zn/Cd) transporter